MTRKRPKLPELASADPDVTQAWQLPDYDGRTWRDASDQQQGTDSPGTDPFAAIRAEGRRAYNIRQRQALPPAALPDFQPAPPQQHAPGTDPAPVAAAVAKGWAHLFAIDCQFPAAEHDTPIPCGSVYRDDAAGSFSDLRKSAYAAGWRMDRLNRMCCPACAQGKALFTLYPVTFWADGAAEARAGGVMYRNPETGREWPLEFALTVLAEMRLGEEVTSARAAGGRHRAATA
jgi:hypothetical protein